MSDTATILRNVAGTLSLAPGEVSPLVGLVVADEGAGAVTVGLEVASGALSALAGGGVTVAGSGTAMLTLSGTTADINTFIATGSVTARIGSAAGTDLVVTVDDGSGAANAVATALVLLDVNGAPDGIALSNAVILESARTGSAVGTLSASDPDGDAVTFSLLEGAADNASFALQTGEDGTTTLRLARPLDHEQDDGVYQIVISATDTAGNETLQTLSVTAGDDPFKLSSAPTGKNYTSIAESAAAGTEIGYISAFDASFTPVSATLTDDAGGLFAMTTRDVNGQMRTYLTLDGTLDHETAELHAVTIEATGADGTTAQKTFEVHVLDAPEAGDTPRGTITIDAATALAADNGGVDWDGYLDAAYANVVPSLPGGVAFAPETSGEYVYSLADGSLLALQGEDLAYWWSDPATGEDVHVVGGTISAMVFGNDEASVVDGTVGNPELTISGLDLQNGVGALDRIHGEANVTAATFMYGPDAGSPADIEFVKALVASYAQTFLGSDAGDTYTGTLFGDVVLAGDGGDRITAGSGADHVLGQRGDDLILGDTGEDTLIGNGGEDTLRGGDDKDRILGGYGDDSIHGNAGHDVIAGNEGNDRLFGGSGRDRIITGTGDDVVRTGKGRDLVVLQDDFGTDRVVDFADGQDRFDLRGHSGVASFDDLDIWLTDAGRTRIEVGDDLIVLSSVAVDLLDASDFIF